MSPSRSLTDSAWCRQLCSTVPQRKQAVQTCWRRSWASCSSICCLRSARTLHQPANHVRTESIAACSHTSCRSLWRAMRSRSHWASWRAYTRLASSLRECSNQIQEKKDESVRTQNQTDRRHPAHARAPFRVESAWQPPASSTAHPLLPAGGAGSACLARAWQPRRGPPGACVVGLRQGRHEASHSTHCRSLARLCWISRARCSICALCCRWRVRAWRTASSRRACAALASSASCMRDCSAWVGKHSYAHVTCTCTSNTQVPPSGSLFRAWRWPLRLAPSACACLALATGQRASSNSILCNLGLKVHAVSHGGFAALCCCPVLGSLPAYAH